MKTLTIELPDEVYDRAERRAASLGTSLGKEVVELLGHFAAVPNSEPTPSVEIVRAEVARLLAALDKARNVNSVGPLKRDELYDRNVLH